MIKAQRFMALYQQDRQLSVIEEDDNHKSDLHSVHNKITKKSSESHESDYQSVMAHIKRVSVKDDFTRKRSVSYSGKKSPSKIDKTELLNNSEFLENLKNKRKGYFSNKKKNKEDEILNLQEVKESSKENLCQKRNAHSISSHPTTPSKSDSILNDCFGEVVKDVMAMNRIKLRRITTKMNPESIESLQNFEQKILKVDMYDKKIETDQKATKDQKKNFS